MAKRLNSREGDFANIATRNRLYTFLKGFADDGSADRLNRKLSSLKTEGEKFDCLRSEARTVCTMNFVRDHSEEILRAMENDGFRIEKPNLKNCLSIKKRTLNCLNRRITCIFCDAEESE